MNKEVQLGRIYKTIKRMDAFVEYIIPMYELAKLEDRPTKRYRYMNVETGKVQGWPMTEHEILSKYRLVDMDRMHE